MKFIESLVYLESCIGTENPAGSVNGSTTNNSNNSNSSGDGKHRSNNGNSKQKSSHNNHHHRRSSSNIDKTPPFEYVAFKPIVSQPMFVSATLTVLREKRWTHMHASWIKLLVSCLPKFSSDMSKIIVPVVYQLCANLKSVTKIYRESCNSGDGSGSTTKTTSSSSSQKTPNRFEGICCLVVSFFIIYCLVTKLYDSCSQDFTFIFCDLRSQNSYVRLRRSFFIKYLFCDFVWHKFSIVALHWFRKQILFTKMIS